MDVSGWCHCEIYISVKIVSAKIQAGMKDALESAKLAKEIACMVIFIKPTTLPDSGSKYSFSTSKSGKQLSSKKV